MASGGGPVGSEAAARRAPRFAWGSRTHVMGVINATPDSFSGDGLGDDPEAAVAQGVEMARAGADILDVGGESTRPGSRPVPGAVQAARVVPVIAALSRRLAIPVSVDTADAAVAEAACAAGATLVNDVWGLRRDPEVATVAARAGAGLLVVHNRMATARSGAVGGYYPSVAYSDLMAEVRSDLAWSLECALARGVPAEDVWVDPGLGFGKTPAQTIEALRRLAELRSLGCPIVVGPSRKSFLGAVLDLPVGEREEGTAAAVALAVASGADVVRVHSVAAMVRVARVADAVIRGWTAP